MSRVKFLSAAVYTVILAGCATGRDLPRFGTMLAEATGQNGRACVRQGDIRSYGVLKGDVVSIHGMKHYYLATVLPGCVDLQSSVKGLFSGGFGEVCGGGMDRLVTGGDSCTIGQMFEFKNRDEAFAVYEAVLKKREELKKGEPSGNGQP